MPFAIPHGHAEGATSTLRHKATAHAGAGSSTLAGRQQQHTGRQAAAAAAARAEGQSCVGRVESVSRVSPFEQASTRRQKCILMSDPRSSTTKRNANRSMRHVWTAMAHRRMQSSPSFPSILHLNLFILQKTRGNKCFIAPSFLFLPSSRENCAACKPSHHQYSQSRILVFHHLSSWR